MQFARPVPFEEALWKIGDRTPIGSQLNSTTWGAVPLALRERAFFSSQVESVRFLQRARESIQDFLSGAKEVLADGQTVLKTGSRADFVKQLSAFAIAEGMGPLDPEDAGTIKDITSQKRLELIFDTQTRQAQDYGYWKQGMDPAVLDAFPAQRFIREVAVKEERDSHQLYEDQVFLKSDLDIWIRINEDFGVPWGPWGWGCGHGVEDVDRAEAEELGLRIPKDPNTQLPKSVEMDFNERLEASARGLDADMLQLLRTEFGDQVQIDGEMAGTEPAQRSGAT
jgi:hypothetical protein